MEYPNINFGTYRLGNDTRTALLDAISNGYRGIDTASLYKVEHIVGQVIDENQINRCDLFYTTKLNPNLYAKSASEIKDAIVISLESLRTKYIDLFLIHKPQEEHIIKCWSVMEEFYRQGIIKKIGVSNFDVHHMEMIHDFSQVPIYTNQIELSPFLKRPNVVKYMNERNIKISAHSSMAKGEKFDDETIVKIANKYGKTPAQIMLKWGLQNNYHIIPRSSKKEHIAEDITLSDFNINDNDMEELNNINITHITHPQYKYRL